MWRTWTARGLRRISSTTRAIEVEPKVNPKTGSEMVFVSGAERTAANLSHEYGTGPNVERLTPGEGEASNPSWHPGGQIIAYRVDAGIRHRQFQHFLDGSGDTGLYSTDARRGAQREPVLGTRRTPHRFHVHPQRLSSNLEYAG